MLVTWKVFTAPCTTTAPFPACQQSIDIFKRSDPIEALIYTSSHRLRGRIFKDLSIDIGE